MKLICTMRSPVSTMSASMDVLKFIGSIPERLLAALLGITILPLRSYSYFIQSLFVAALASIALLIGAPIIMGFVFNSFEMPKLVNIALTLLIIVPLTTALVALGAAVVLTVLLAQTLYDMGKNIWAGLSNGLTNGLDGFGEAYTAQRSPFAGLFVRLGAFLNSIPQEEQIGDLDFDGFQRIAGELVDVVVAPQVHDVPDLESAELAGVHNLLREGEVTSANELINKFSQLEHPLDPAVKADLNTLKVRVAHYTDLATRLSKVQAALNNGDKSEIEDQLVVFNDVETPIFFAKQYKADNGQWLNVPAQGYVTNKESLLTWLKGMPKHPLNKEFIKNPPPHNDKETRYKWHELTKENCYTQELGECADEIRALMKTLPDQSEAARKQTISVGASPLALHGQPRPSRPADVVEEVTFENRV